MRKITFLLMLLTITFGFSQVNVTVDGSKTWNGYVIAFNAADDTYAFDFAYTLADIKTTITATSATLQPNFAIWQVEANNSAWFDNPGNPPSNPNKKIEGLSYVEDNSLVGQAVDFTGTVGAITINASYQVSAFIKILDGTTFATLTDERVPLTTAGDFSVSVDATQTGAGGIVQYGFVVYGLIADPATEASLGSVVVDERLNNNTFETNQFSVYPNPSKNSWNISGLSTTINTIEVFDVLGKQITSLSPNSISVSIDASSLKNGIYLAKVSTDSGAKTLKLVKN